VQQPPKKGQDQIQPHKNATTAEAVPQWWDVPTMKDSVLF